MRAEVAFDSEWSYQALRNGPFREPTAGDTDLDYVAGRKKTIWPRMNANKRE